MTKTPFIHPKRLLLAERPFPKRRRDLPPPGETINYPNRFETLPLNPVDSGCSYYFIHFESYRTNAKIPKVYTVW